MNTNLPPSLSADIFDPSHEGRTQRLLSQKEYNYVRARQLEHRLQNEHSPLIGVLWRQDHPLLKHSVVIGDKGETIALYENKVLGRGSFGKVYFGVNCDTGQFHAVKIQNILNDYPEHIEDIKHEIQVLSDLDRLDDVLAIDNHNEVGEIIAQPFASGANYFDCLFNLLDERTCEKRDVDLIEKLDMALGAIHEIQRLHDKGYLHRDIKLNNLMWDQQTNQSMAIDFGTTRKMNENHVYQGPLVGTELYMAPEYLRNFSKDDPDYTVPGEIYALGVCLAQIFSDNINHAHPRKQTIFYATDSQAKGLSPYFEKMAPDLFTDKKIKSPLKDIASIVRKMLDIDPTKRESLDKASKHLTKIREKVQKEHDKISKHARKAPGCILLKSNPLLYQFQAKRRSFKQDLDESLKQHHSMMPKQM